MGNSPSESVVHMDPGVFTLCQSCQRALPAIEKSWDEPHFTRNEAARRFEFTPSRGDRPVVYMCDFEHSGYKCKPCFLSWTYASGKLTNSTDFKLRKMQETFFGTATHMFMQQPNFPSEVEPGASIEFTLTVKPEFSHPAWAVVYNVVNTDGVVAGKVTLGGEVSIDTGTVTHGIVPSPVNALPNLAEVTKMSDGLYVNDAHALMETKSETQRSGNRKVDYTLSKKATKS